MIGMSESFPVTQNWSYLVDELIHNVKTKVKQPVIGLGHSLGGVLNLLAAYKEPQLFKLVVMLDSPTLSPWKSMALRMINWLGLVDYVTPAKKAKNRQTQWGSKEEAKAYLNSRELFKEFHHQCIDDYINYAMAEDKEGILTLRYCREREYKIYRTIPYNMPNLKTPPEVPVVLIYGENSDIVTPYDIRYMSDVGGFHTICCQGGHMFPLEYPQETVEKITNAISFIDA